MPELPEIITIRNDLKNHVQGRTITKITRHDDFPLKPDDNSFTKYVKGARIEEVTNVAKIIVFVLSNGKYLTAHLRMSGNLFLNHRDPYVKIELELDDTSLIMFSTVRKFGYLEVWDDTKLNEYSQRLGKTLLESNLGPKEFSTLVGQRKAPVKNVLLNQQVVSGIGNIYANDALFLSKIHPATPSNRINENSLKILHQNLVRVLKLGVKNRGSSIDRFRDAFGNPGQHQNHFFVYGNKGNRCTQCDSGKIVYEKIGGRGTYYCPTCQKLQS